jgi:hypothetical protein
VSAAQATATFEWFKTMTIISPRRQNTRCYEVVEANRLRGAPVAVVLLHRRASKAGITEIPGSSEVFESGYVTIQ